VRHASSLCALIAGAGGSGRQVLAVGDVQGEIGTIDPISEQTLNAPEAAGVGAVLALLPLPGRRALLVAGGGNGSLARWDIAAGRLVGEPWVAHAGPVRDLCLLHTPGGFVLASAGQDGTIRLWELDREAAVSVGSLTGHGGWVWSLCPIEVTDDPAPLLASGGADATVRIWDPIKEIQVGTPLIGHTDQVRVVRLTTSADGRTLLVSGSHDGTVRLWHPATREPVRTIPLGIPVHSLAPQPHDKAARDRTDGGATLLVGTRHGALALDLNHSLFPSRL
jgi:WD40 repeat protein